MAYPQYDPREDVTDTLMKQQGASTFDYGLAGLGTAQMQAPGAAAAAAAMPPGMPSTPTGGVPGSGLATAPPSTVQLPPQRTGMMGAMPAMRGLGQMSNMEAGMAGQSLQRMQPPLGGIGQMSDIEAAQAGQSLGRMRRPRY